MIILSLVRKALSKAELVNHPVRLRILEHMAGRNMTSLQIAEGLKDVPQATLYRQIKLLHEGGILDVVDQRQAHGVIELTYAQRKGSTHLSREEFASMSPEDHLGLFAMMNGTASTSMARYFNQDPYDTTQDGMTYFAAGLDLSEADARKFRSDLLDFIRNYPRDPEAPRRLRRITVSIIPEASK